MSRRRKRFFAQNAILTATGHRARYFDDLDAAVAWLRARGGGTVKRRGAGVAHDPFVG